MGPVHRAFKEWSSVVAHLGAGRQSLIVRKGGIAEDRPVNEPLNEPFWLFPTAFHAQEPALKPGTFCSDAPATGEGGVPVQFRVHRSYVRWIETWSEMERLDEGHTWTAETLRRRFDWDIGSGVWVALVEVEALPEPVTLPLRDAYRGCKSWVDLNPDDVKALESKPTQRVASRHDTESLWWALHG